MRKTPSSSSAAKAVVTLLAECKSVEVEDANGGEEAAAAAALEVMLKMGVEEFILDSNVVATRGAVIVCWFEL